MALPLLSPSQPHLLRSTAVPANLLRIPTVSTRTPSPRPPRLPAIRAIASGLLLGDYAAKPGVAPKVYERRGSCLVFPPPKGRRPRAIIEFLGGAFVGAVPEATYGHLMGMLAGEGFLVVSVPYDVTFDHRRAARDVYDRFRSCLGELLDSGMPGAGLDGSELEGLPLYSVGHSNGALLQLLIGSYFSENIPKANAVVSFNNKPASEAVPYYEQFGPLFSTVAPLMESSPIYSMVRTASGDAWKTLMNAVEAFAQGYDSEPLISLTKFGHQLPSLINQVNLGVSEFKPTPFENRSLFKQSYNVQNTLLVKFSTDSFDETDDIYDVLRPRVDSVGGMIQKVTLSGNHLTPCVQDLTWEVGNAYTPADAVAQGLKAISLSDTKVLARTIADWLRRIPDFQF